MDSIWTLYGLYMDSIWTLYGLYMDSIWTLYGHYMDSIWTLYGLIAADNVIDEYPTTVLLPSHILCSSFFLPTDPIVVLEDFAAARQLDFLLEKPLSI
jgi:hypothetical protein